MIINNDSFLKRAIMVIIGSTIFASALNLFVVPIGLYNGGVVGISQIIRTILTTYLHLNFNFDIAGVINLLINIPLFIIAYKALSKQFMALTAISLITQTIAISLIPIPTTPIINDILASCVIAGVLGGAGIGIVLLNKASGGGTDIVGMYLSQKNSTISVGRIYLIVNAFIYILCAILFDFKVAVYSIIFSAIYSAIMDKVHLQNIEVSLMIFTKDKSIKKMINYDFHRGVTYWKGMGAYTDTETEVLMTIVSKYEVAKIRRSIMKTDPKAFVIVNEGLQVTGGYEKRLV